MNEFALPYVHEGTSRSELGPQTSNNGTCPELPANWINSSQLAPWFMMHIFAE
jgi:hypothetical protein